MTTDSDNSNGQPASSEAPSEAVASPRPAERQPGKQPGPPRVLRPLFSRRSRPISPLPGETEQYRGTSRHVIFSALILTAILSVIIAVPILPGPMQMEVGKPATQDIFSPTSLRFESKVLTQRARDDAAKDPANEVWVQDTDLVQRQRSILLNNLSVVDTVRREVPQRAAQIERLSSLQGISLTETLADTVLSMSNDEYQYWRDGAVIPAFDGLMRDRRLASNADVEAAHAGLPGMVPAALPTDFKDAAVAFVSPLLAINVRLDEDQTNQRRDDAAAAVKPVVVTVQKGEAILRQGDLVTPEAIEKMQEAGLLSRDVSPQNVIGTTVFVALLMLIQHLYIYRQAPQVWRRQKQLLLLGMLMVATVVAARVLLPGHSVLPYMLPVAAVSMLVAVLLDTNLAVLVTFILSLLLGMVVGSGLSLSPAAYYIVGGLVGIFSLTRVEKVSTFALAGFNITVASFVTSIAVRVLTGTPLDITSLTDSSVQLLALAAVFNGVMSASITYGTFSLLGTLFGITTPLQLMELAHPDQPLLRRLMREAPGTYHHSLMVSNLAERAAEMIGADSLLTRVSAYYHDIGKVVRPYYFIDNQSGMSNIHDEMDPRTSAQVIIEHVRDGISLGQKYKLPRRILDAMPQHHGTMLVKYFYYKALEADPTIDADDFRYPGPKPQTKENAILMLADGVEATVRSMAQSGALDKLAAQRSDATESPSRYTDASSLPEEAVAAVVHRVISERIEDGQLDECDLTVRDIARIQEAFVLMLKGIYHPRITYPEAPKALAAPAETTATPAVTRARRAPFVRVVPTPAEATNGVSPQNGDSTSLAAAVTGPLQTKEIGHEQQSTGT